VHQLRVFVLLLTAILATACDDDPTDPSDVIGDTWRLEVIELTGAPPLTVDNPSRYTLRLEENGRAAVMSDCNTCSGPYTLAGSALMLGPIACTKVACGPGSLDPQYAKGLESAQSVSLGESTMVVRGDGVTLRFRR